MSNYLVTVNLVILNGEKYIRHCLDGILGQTYPKELIEFNILDNGSTDGTIDRITNYELRIKKNIPKFIFTKSKINLGMWPGQEELLKYSNGKYILGMAVDVILDKNFVKNAVEVMEQDSKIGAIQAKIYRFDQQPTTNDPQFTKIIDTCGFRIFKSRRIVNIGHGEKDRGQYDNLGEIFGIEGACPFFRKGTLENCGIEVRPRGFFEVEPQKLQTEIFDHDYFWYGDDLDLAWRMNLFGWKQVFVPSVIAWHDRQTTKNLKRNWSDYMFRVPARQQIPIKKRRLDWRNTRFTIIKNDYIINILKDLGYILTREVAVLVYTLLFEPKVFLELPRFLKLLPKMLQKRKEVMKRAQLSPEKIKKYFE